MKFVDDDDDMSAVLSWRESKWVLIHGTLLNVDNGQDKWFKGTTVVNSCNETTSCNYITTVTDSLKHSKQKYRLMLLLALSYISLAVCEKTVMSTAKMCKVMTQTQVTSNNIEGWLQQQQINSLAN